MPKQSATQAAISQKIQDELDWLVENPHFRERPASLVEFLGPKYLAIEKGVRPRIRDELEIIMGKEVSGERPTAYQLAMVTGGIGIGKTTIAAIVLPYLCHWVLCLRDPQGHFDLLPGSRIAFMMMSTSATQAKEVLFADVKARIAHSPWFKKYPIDKDFKNQIRFDGDVWIIPGDSGETTFEGYNILGGILDEADSHKITPTKDYAAVGWDTIFNRMSSRFQDRGFLLTIGQMKSSSGFASRKFKELSENPTAYATTMTIWESRGDEFYRDKKTGEIKKFWFNNQRKQIIPDQIVAKMGTPLPSSLMHIPWVYREQFVSNPEKALKDLAGMPPTVQDPFISLDYKIYECRDRWTKRNIDESPVDAQMKIQPWFRAPDTLPRVAHIDIGYSGNGDAAGIAMGHIPEMIETEDGERKPFIEIDFMMRVKVRPGQEVMLSDLRRIIYDLRDKFGFKLKVVTLDGFESKDTIQQLSRRRFQSGYLSVDKQLLPYHDLREAIYDNRLAFPPYMVDYTLQGGELTEILVKELSELMDMGRKIDHPPDGSKDVADAVAAVVTTLMGARKYHRSNRGEYEATVDESRFDMPDPFEMAQKHHAYTGSTGLSAPVPPNFGG